MGIKKEGWKFYFSGKNYNWLFKYISRRQIQEFCIFKFNFLSRFLLSPFSFDFLVVKVVVLLVLSPFCSTKKCNCPPLIEFSSPSLLSRCDISRYQKGYVTFFYKLSFVCLMFQCDMFTLIDSWVVQVKVFGRFAYEVEFLCPPKCFVRCFFLLNQPPDIVEYILFYLDRH